MKVLLLEDVYKLGRAGDVKKVADGYGRNYLLPQGLAVLATPGALQQVDKIRTQASVKRSALNEEMGGVAQKLENVVLLFPARAGETGKLYGSITSQMIAEALQEKTGVQLDRRHVDVQPIRTLGEHKVHVRLTVDLVPEIKVLVHREGEAPETGAKPVVVEEPTGAPEAAAVEAAIESGTGQEETPAES
jgi:large subunit ribosomal protein L9